MSINYEKLGETIRFFRTEKALSQDELAEYIDITRVHLSDIERGQTHLSVDILVLLSNALNVSTEVLLSPFIVKSENRLTSEQLIVLNDCSPEETDIIINCIKTLKSIIKEYHISK